MHVGNLLTISRRMYLGAAERPTPAVLPQRAAFRTKTSAHKHSKMLAEDVRHGDHDSKDLGVQNRISEGGRQLLSVDSDSKPVAIHTPRRHLTSSNQLVGGVFLHHKRLKKVTSCAPRFSQKLFHTCRYKQATGNILRGNVVTCTLRNWCCGRASSSQ